MFASVNPLRYATICHALFCVIGLTGCTTTVRTYREDGKTLLSETKVGVAHEVTLPDGVYVTTSQGVVSAAQEVAIKAVEVGGAAVAVEAVKAASEAARPVKEASTTEGQ